jgi:hypothetical protein
MPLPARPPLLSRTALAVILASAVACSGADRESGGADGPALWRVGDPLVRIGSLEGNDALSDVAALLVTPWDEVWILEGQSARVRVFGVDGTPRRTVGGPGEGPGEFRGPNWLGLAGDTVMVSDARLRRTAFFLADGSHVGGRPHRRLAQVPQGLTQTFGAPLPGGRDILATVPRPRMPPEPTLPAHPDSTRPLYLVASDDAPPDRLGDLEGAPNRGIVVSTVGGEITGVMIIRQPFSDETLWAAAPDGASVAFVRRRVASSPQPATYTLVRVSMTGDTLYATERIYDPVPLDPALADSVAEELGGAGGTSQEVRAELFVPAYRPPASRLLVAHDGATWVRREDLPGGASSWDVFDARGTLVANIEEPSDVEFRRVTTAGVWGVLRDDLDVPYVVLFPVIRDTP